MASTLTENRVAEDPDQSPEPEVFAIGDTVRRILMPLASLKLTVVLFALAIFIVLAGTLAQTQLDIWEVVHQYFRTPIAWIDFQVFFPKSFFPNLPPIPGGTYFPGGWLIGFVMALNLLAAHAVRFTVQARGTRLAAGLALIAVGSVVTYLVIIGGSSADGLQGVPFFEWSTLWLLVKWGIAGLAVGGAVLLGRIDPSRRAERQVLAGCSAVLGLLACWLIYAGDTVALGDSSMRILWQLIQGGLAGLVLLAGCVLAFKKRGGVVLLHAGVGLMMASELLVGMSAVESQMHIREGETVNFVQDLRTFELAVVDKSATDHDDVVVIPKSILLGKQKRIQSTELPFDVEVIEFLQNSTPRRLQSGESSPATTGTGLQWTVEKRSAGKGTDTDSKVDMSAAYVKFLKKGTDESLGTHLLGLFMSLQEVDEKVVVDGKTYDVALRLKRTYKPYEFTLKDVRADNYLGTATTKNYSSDLRLVDPSRNVDREVKIWMNNPLRYAGETFYQSTFDASTGVEMTGLQVVTNAGWMIPYVSCMIVATGLLAQFSVTLLRFLQRRMTVAPAGSLLEGETRRKQREPVLAPRPGILVTAFPLFVVMFFAAWLVSKARPEKQPADGMHLTDFGKLPVIKDGRVKPLDTLARNTLRIISDKETFVDAKGKQQPAIRWLLDVISGTAAGDAHQVFRIENLELLDVLGLKRRAGFRYSIDEFRDQMPKFIEQAKLADDTAKESREKLSVYQRKVLEFKRKLETYMLVSKSFQPPRMPEIPSMEEFKDDKKREDARMRLMQISQVLESVKGMRASLPPLVVPVKSDKPAKSDKGGEKPADAEAGDTDWEPYALAWTEAFVKTRIMGQDVDPATGYWNGMLVGYAKGDAKMFNTELSDYQKYLDKERPAMLETGNMSFEAFFNHFAPFYHASVLYVFAFIISALAWLKWTGPLNRVAFWLLVFTLGVHTFALIARIYISGRPPVTNLYSSAVFIGWGCVVLGLMLERIYRLGVGNVLASIAGFATLLIAHFLAGDGDTFTVLQAVLDTQFWLATHVVCITLGYATTFMAGLLGMFYILRGVLTPSLSASVAKDVTRMIYGTLCFALFFSFVGTVLGGLWADDSWGRFWGWDPKENGALIIVLWNALVLHARWDGMVKERGLAVLAVIGNITTSWSWFGVNELGVGLHSYGFTEGVLLSLGVFVASQMAIAVAGMLPKDMWWSFRTLQGGKGTQTA